MRSIERKPKNLGIMYQWADKKLKFLALKHQGLSTTAAAKQLGISAGTANKWYWEAIEETYQETKKYAHLLASRDIQHVEQMLQALAPAASTGDRKAIETQLKLLEHRAKLLNLYPHETVQHNDLTIINFPGMTHLINRYTDTQQQEAHLLPGDASTAIVDNDDSE